MRLILTLTLLTLTLFGIGCTPQDGLRRIAKDTQLAIPQRAPTIQVSDDLDEALNDLALIEDIP